MSSPHGDRDEAMYAGEGRHGKQENPTHRKAARGKAAGVIVGVILAIFVILLAVWLLGQGTDDVGSSPAPFGEGAAAVLLTDG